MNALSLTLFILMGIISGFITWWFLRDKKIDLKKPLLYNTLLIFGIFVILIGISMFELYVLTDLYGDDVYYLTFIFGAVAFPSYFLFAQNSMWKTKKVWKENQERQLQQNDDDMKKEVNKNDKKK